MRLAAALLGALFLLAATPAAARSPRIAITITENAGGVRIVYDLPAPARALAVRGAGEDAPPPGSHVRVLESGLSYARGRVSGAAPFRRFTLLIAPDDGDVDSRYPLLSPIAGRGYVLFAPYILPDGPIAARVSIGGGRSRALPRGEAEGGYVLTGAKAAGGGAFRTLASTTTPAGLEARLSARAGALLGFYRERLHRGLRRPPTLIISYFEEPAGQANSLFRGDVTPNGVVLLRFHGTGAQLADPGSTGRYTSFLAHELFHLWNRRLGNPADSEAWLHEGSAEYYSWIAVAALWPREIDVDRNLLNALHLCTAFMDAPSFASLSAEGAAGIRYSCGPVAQWVVDAGVRGASGGRRTGFDLWARLLAGGRGDYSLAGFRAAARARAPVTAPFLDGLIETGVRWEDLAPALNAAGAEIGAAPPSRDSILFVATRAIVQSMCPAFWGAGNDDQGVYFDSQPCRMAGTFTHLVRVDDIDPMADPDLFYAHLRDACARQAGLALVLRNQDGESRRTIRCTVAVGRPAPDFRIARALPLSPPARSAP